MSPRFRQLSQVISAITLILLLPDPAQAEKPKTETKEYDPIDWLRALEVAPSTEAIAMRQGYVLRGIQTGIADTKPQAGDTVTALVQLASFDSKRPPSQWIIRLQLAANISTDSSQGKSNNFTEYTNTGEKFTFHFEQAGMKLETLGPIKPETRPDRLLPVRHHEISVATDFLSLDLCRAAQVIQRISSQPREKVGWTLTVSSSAFPDEEVNQQRPRAAALNLTADELRSFSGSLPALMQFLDIVRNTPDLQEILFQVLDKPSLIDVFRNGASRSIHFEFRGGSGQVNGQDIFWPDTKQQDFGVLKFDLVVFKKPVLTVVLYMTTPRPPLLVTAGIVGVVAFKPKPDMADKFVVVRVLSAAAGGQ